MWSVEKKRASRKTVSSSICKYEEVKVNLHYRLTSYQKKRPEARTYAKYPVRVTADGR